MSHDLESLLDTERRTACARNDAAMQTAHGITRTGPAKVSGKHLGDAANEPEPFAFTEEELLAADVERMQRRDQRFREQLATVHELELAYFRRMGYV